jgi:hypothetical protein
MADARHRKVCHRKQVCHREFVIGGWEAKAIKQGEFHMMAYHDLQQQFPFQNLQTAWLNPQLAQTYGPGYGFGQAAYGQQFGQPNMGAWGSWGQHRQLSQNEVGDVVRQLVPLLPQLIAQAQQQPQAALGFGGGFGQGYGQLPKFLTQQDVNEVVRQILPVLPQIVGMLQGQGAWQGTLGGPLHAAMHGGLNSQFAPQPNPLAQLANSIGNPWQQNPLQQWSGQQNWGQHNWGQQNWPQAMPAYGPLAWGQQAWGQRNLTQHDVSEVARQLVNVIPQVISNLQAQNLGAQGQQRMN